MQSRTHTVIPGLIMIIISSIFLIQSITMEKADITDPSSGNFFPALITTIMLITGIVVLFNKPKTVEVSEDGEEIINEEEIFKWKDYQTILLYFFIILVYVIILPIISFFPSTFIFLFLSMLFLRKVSLKLNLVVSIGTVIVIYLLFSQLFKIIFP